ncbi:MAG: SMC-Scp complex subunit ScpB [Bacillota bacterium]|jgi:segregation and condensation protein B|nr:SMC-Scp complex subunit ScpB [Bacillota bacterium]
MALSRENLKAVIEAILFLTEEPVRADKIASGLGISSKEAQNLLCELQQELIEQQRGLRIFEVAGGYQMGTAPELAPYLEQAVSEEESGRLSTAALETLAIIAYKQPLTRLEIESVRGVRCEHILDNLLKRKLIRVSGRKEGPGRPLVYATTQDFLRFFGLKDLNELPPLDR